MWEAIAAIAGSLGTLVTGAGIWFVYRQLRDGRRSLRAQFIMHLRQK